MSKKTGGKKPAIHLVPDKHTGKLFLVHRKNGADCMAQHRNQEVEETIAAMQKLNAPEPILEAARLASLISSYSAPLIRPRADSIEKIFEAFWKFSQERKYELGPTLAALFDLLVGLDFVEYLFSRDAHSPLGALACKGGVYLPFVNACPNCLINEKKVVETSGHKPQSAHIGEASSQILSHLLTLLLRKKGGDPEAEVRVANRTNGEIDAAVILPQARVLILSEVKASPLVTYPVRLYTCTQPTSLDQHKILRVKAADVSKAAFLLQNNGEIDIGSPYESPCSANHTPQWGWAFRGFAAQVEKNDQVIAHYLNHWLELYRVLKNNLPPSERPIQFFLTHGSGKRDGVNVSDSKNAPGFDRTDDIKKATYQIAFMLSKYILGKSAENVFVGILSNLGPTSHFEDYLRDILKVALCLPTNSTSAKAPRYCVPRTHWRYLFDAIITFDYTFFNSPRLKHVFQPLFSHSR